MLVWVLPFLKLEARLSVIVILGRSVSVGPSLTFPYSTTGSLFPARSTHFMKWVWILSDFCQGGGGVGLRDNLPRRA